MPVTQAMRDAADRARNEALTEDPNDQISALNLALDAAWWAAPSHRQDQRARAANTRADKLQKENTILRDRLGIAPHHVVLPRNVYFSAPEGRFRDAKTRHDMGDDFLAEWGERWTLFPVAVALGMKPKKE